MAERPPAAERPRRRKKASEAPTSTTASLVLDTETRGRTQCRRRSRRRVAASLDDCSRLIDPFTTWKQVPEFLDMPSASSGGGSKRSRRHTGLSGPRRVPRPRPPRDDSDVAGVRGIDTEPFQGAAKIPDPAWHFLGIGDEDRIEHHRESDRHSVAHAACERAVRDQPELEAAPRRAARVWSASGDSSRRRETGAKIAPQRVGQTAGRSN